MNQLDRSSGVLLHITSLSGATLGAGAHRFVDWLADAGQSWWQVLPLSPPDEVGSPYKSVSAFAGWRGLLAAPRARVTAAEVLEFRDREAFWIEDWARYGPGEPRELIADQVRFWREWAALREYAGQRGVKLLGDVAIYVAPESVDHRAHPDLFLDDRQAGVPPDAFSDLGQLWGNPVYDWAALRRSGYRWWVERIAHHLRAFDAVRLDHFRGFVAYWGVPVGAADARSGHWRRGPGLALFEAIQGALGEDLPLVAEDLGMITAPVERLRDRLDLPGMIVLQFGFGPRDERVSPHAFVNHARHRFVYTGTHDHDTARGWYESIDPETRARVDRLCASLRIEDPEPWWRLVHVCLRSEAAVAIFQAQDILGLGSDARMNNPVGATGNWKWRLQEGALDRDLAARVREATAAVGRC